jgi:hypothetical protein
MQRDPKPTKDMLVAVCIDHTHALLSELTRRDTAARAQRCQNLTGQSLMLPDDKEAPAPVGLGEKRSGTKIAVGNPQIIWLDTLEHRPEQRALLRVAIFTRKDLGNSARRRLIDHERFAGQGAPVGLSQFFDTVLTGFEAVAIDNFDPVTREPGRALAAHMLNEGANSRAL